MMLGEKNSLSITQYGNLDGHGIQRQETQGFMAFLPS